MFTGLIETTGTVTAATRGNKSVVVAVKPQCLPFEVCSGDSVSIDGVCLTVESVKDSQLFFRAVAETAGRTTLADIRPGRVVNMERSLSANGRIDGHFVLGHVDGIGTITEDRPVGDSLVRTVIVPSGLSVFMAEKGSVAVDGISLTIVSAIGDRISLSLIPYSLTHTTMVNKRVGQKVNIESDVLARYLHNFVLRGIAGGAVPSKSGEPDLYGKLERLGF